MIQTLPQLMILLKARINHPKYERIPTEDTLEETIIFEKGDKTPMTINAAKSCLNTVSTSSTSISDKASLYQRIVAHKENEQKQSKPMDEVKKQNSPSLLERIQQHKEQERLALEEQQKQALRKQMADEYAQKEILKIEQSLKEIRQTPITEKIIDARTPPPQQLQKRHPRFPTRKEIGQFTQRVLKPLIENLSKEVITK